MPKGATNGPPAPARKPGRSARRTRRRQARLRTRLHSRAAATTPDEEEKPAPAPADAPATSSTAAEAEADSDAEFDGLDRVLADYRAAVEARAAVVRTLGTALDAAVRRVAEGHARSFAQELAAQFLACCEAALNTGLGAALPEDK